ncbi:hypothetical protein JXJ21_18860 [candidate division KSB1 bacterium]|nr:hypothetical protein [candidate division KSB1 bacterium]
MELKLLTLLSLAGLLILIACFSESKEKYSPAKLFSDNDIRSFTGSALTEIAFPLGGIGTGNVSLGGRGDLRDWEIFNRPGKGKELPFSFFAIWAKSTEGKAVAKILERKLIPPYKGGFGTPQNQMTGVSRLDEAVFRGEYPFAWIDFEDAALPVKVQLEAWTPFIPLDDHDSSIPVAIFRWRIENPGDEQVDISVAACLFNPIGTDGRDFGGLPGGNLNEFVETDQLRGLRLSSDAIKPEDIRFGTMALTTTWEDLDVQTRWYRGGWWDNAHLFWDDFADDGRVTNCKDAIRSDKHRSDIGDLVLHAQLSPKSSVTLPFFLTWHFPQRENYWNREEAVKGKVMRNYVANHFEDALHAAQYTVENLEKLETLTRRWHKSFFSSTLPDYVLDAVSSQASIIRTNTCLRLADGSFFAFEGQGDETGCCPMNCTHVWNYEQTLAHLFPKLERSMRETDFLHNIRDDNSMAFRTLIPLCETRWAFKPAADGQMGCVMKAYREWKFSGDTEWLRKIWQSVKNALEFAWTAKPGWDPNKDGVMEGEQHNTYDIEFYGPNTMMGSLYLGALKAAAEMAEALNEPEKANEYRTIYQNGRKQYDELLWQDDYYIQKVEVMQGLEVPEHLKSPESTTSCACKSTPCPKKPALEKSAIQPKYQYGNGCLSDQLLGQWFAHVVGLDHILDPEHTKTAVHSIFKYNWRNPVGDFSNVQRVYALNDDAGLLLCSWPRGNRPTLPFVYSDEVWTGIEYQVAGHLIYEGWLEQGLKVVKGVRERYDGLRRNPWNEVECGHHYARALASWSVLLALSGYEYDGVKGHLGFAPKLNQENFRCVWTSGAAWGDFYLSQQGSNREIRIEVQFGNQRLNTFAIEGSADSVQVQLDNERIDANLTHEKGKCIVHFEKGVEIGEGSELKILLK